MNVGDPVSSEYARKAAKAVYLELPAAVADDVSRVILETLTRAETAEQALSTATALMERIARLSPEGIQKFANKACQWLCELPDRTSPEDWPEACLVEPQELHDYLVEQLTELSIAQADKGQPNES